MDSRPYQTVSVRIPAKLFASLKSIAEAEKLSFNRLALRALETCAEERRDTETKLAFRARAANPIELEYSNEAQAEVALANPE